MRDILIGILESIYGTAILTWWIFLPIILFFPLRKIYLIYIQDRYIKKMSWTLLEIKVPKEILKTPKAMEQVFAATYADCTHGITFLQLYLDGLLDSWYSFEIVGHAGGVHFYVYTQTKRRNVIESAIYSQYPDAEIHEVPDYVATFGSVLPNEVYDIWGTDLGLKRESAYPIRTYPYFEAMVEEQRLDPISAITEVMSGLKDDEAIWLQFVISPSDDDVGNDWKKEGEELIDKITGRQAAEARKGIGAVLIDWFSNLFMAPVEHPIWPDADEKAAVGVIKFLNPSEQEIVKNIDAKISKLGFETNIRFIYVDKRDSFTSANAVAVMGTIRQFNTQSGNIFKPGKQLTLNKGWRPRFIPFYAKLHLLYVKRKLFSAYRDRQVGSRRVGKYRPTSAKIHTFNTEELATLYHFPITSVGAPKLRRLEAQKGAPPAGLPIE